VKKSGSASDMHLMGGLFAAAESQGAVKKKKSSSAKLKAFRHTSGSLHLYDPNCTSRKCASMCQGQTKMFSINSWRRSASEWTVDAGNRSWNKCWAGYSDESRDEK